MINRVHGCATAARYANTELYSHSVKEPPLGMTWRTYLDQVLELNAPKEKHEIKRTINEIIRRHNKRSRSIIHDSEPDPISGISWKFLCFLAIRGDFKGRRAGNIIIEAQKTLKKQGKELYEVIREEGNTRY